MRVVCLKTNPHQYSCKSYLILGNWNKIEDVNTLIDPGVDGYILPEIAGLSTGFGKKPVEQMILTHGHFDHCSGAKAVKAKHSCLIYGYSSLNAVDIPVIDGQIMRCGDRDLEVLYTPGHSNDSICLYCEEEKILFSGDTQLLIKTPGGLYTEAFIKSLEKIASRQIAKVYPGHGAAIVGNVREMIADSLRNIYQSQIAEDDA
ncbi:MAG: MBL fold metallo-hydrolase [Negativicutes bacterium]|nr:MBL fold metallo-hydrolase [Negativicutes bacterium]